MKDDALPKDREKKVTVLDEDEYTKALDSIIKNQYYPELKQYEMESSIKYSDCDSETTYYSKPSQIPEPMAVNKYENMSLNSFLSSFTSEDNNSFQELSKKADRKH